VCSVKERTCTTRPARSSSAVVDLRPPSSRDAHCLTSCAALKLPEIPIRNGLRANRKLENGAIRWPPPEGTKRRN
jgi:hypothetical protein